jgi:hypothetical protein
MAGKPKMPDLDEHGLNSAALDELAAGLIRDGAEAFLERYECPFLLLQEGPDQPHDWANLSTSEASVKVVGSVPRRPPDARVVPLQKSDRNVFDSRITVGRARNNDVIIRSTKISKLHAAFHPRKASFQLEDMGSLNGTVVNGNQLSKKERMPLQDGDLISFWHYLFEYIRLDSMLEILREIRPSEVPF